MGLSFERILNYGAVTSNKTTEFTKIIIALKTQIFSRGSMCSQNESLKECIEDKSN